MRYTDPDSVLQEIRIRYATCSGMEKNVDHSIPSGELEPWMRVGPRGQARLSATRQRKSRHVQFFLKYPGSEDIRMARDDARSRRGQWAWPEARGLP